MSVLSHVPLAFGLPLPILPWDPVSSVVTSPRPCVGVTAPFHAGVSDTTHRSLRGIAISISSLAVSHTIPDDLPSRYQTLSRHTTLLTPDPAFNIPQDPIW
jgi:hypothetical protein